MNRFRPYFVYLRPHLPAFGAAIVCAVVYGVASGFGIAYMLEQVLPSLFRETTAQLSVWQTIGLAALIPLAFLVRGVSGYLNSWFIALCGLRTLADLRTALFDKMQRLQLAFFQQRPSGDLVSRLSTDTLLVQQVLTTVANDLIKQPATLLAALGYLVYQAYANAQFVFILVSLAVIPVCIFPIRVFGKRLLRKARLQQDRVGDLTEVIAENVGGAREVRAYNQEAKQRSVFVDRIQALVISQLKVVRYSQILGPTIEVITSVGVAAAFVYAYRSGVALETFVSLMPALYFSYDAVKKLGNLHNRIQGGAGALERLEEILDEPETVAEPTNPISLDRSSGALTFEDVDFHYGQVPALESIDLTIRPGETVALVGPSGAGKTTFANLIPRFHDPTRGRVLLDGHDLTTLSLADLRRQIALVPQDPFLFRDTLAANIALGQPDAQPDAIEAAARRAQIHGFIMGLSEGYATPAGERGSQLSGGQRQRIALARALLRDAPVLILDEATSALDAESEQKIQEALAASIQGRTTLIIAHRFSTIQMADRILLFDRGRIVADGTFDALMKQPLFKRLYENQRLQA